jgi:hypothetical protein
MRLGGQPLSLGCPAFFFGNRSDTRKTSTTGTGHRTTRTIITMSSSPTTKTRNSKIKGGQVELNDKQRLFCAEYVKDLNQTAAALRAGYSKNRARNTASELMAKPLVQEEISRLAGKVLKNCEIDATYVLMKAKEMLERCMQDVPVMDTNGEPTGEYKFDSAGAGKALKILGDHVAVNAFKATDEGGTPIDMNWVVKIVHTDARTNTTRKT